MSNLIPLALILVIAPGVTWGSILLAKWASHEEAKKYPFLVRRK